MRRLIYCFLAVCALLFSAPSFALDVLGSWSASSNNARSFSDSGACMAYEVQAKKNSMYNFVEPQEMVCGSGICYYYGQFKHWSTDSYLKGIFCLSSSPKCTANATLGASGCSCNAGYVEIDGQCAPKPEDNQCRAGTANYEIPRGTGKLNAAGDDLIDLKYFSQSTIMRAYCMGGCRYYIDNDNQNNFKQGGDIFWSASASPGTSVVFNVIAGMVSIGEKCDTTEPTPDSPPGDDGRGDNSGDGPKQPDPSDDGGKSGTDSPGDGGTGGTGGSPGDGGKTPGTTSGNSGDNGSGDGDNNGGSGGGKGGGGTGGDSGNGSEKGKDGDPSASDGSGGSGKTGAGDSGGTGKDGSCEGQDCHDTNAGPGLPGQPKLYEPKYPEGVSGVWNEQVGQLHQTPVFTLVNNMMPTSINGGNASLCWSLDFDFGGMLNFGAHQFCIDPSIWPILRAIVMVSALLLAYKLVFGGA